MTIPDEAVQAAHSAYLECVFLTEEQVISSMKKMLTAALPFLQGVKVKAMEWTAAKFPESYVSKNSSIQYSITWDDDAEWSELSKPYDLCRGDSYGEALGSYETANDAKAAAQADYDARILSAIEPAPSPRAQALEEAAQNACMYLETGFIECPKCGEEVETKHTDAEYTLRSALSSQPVADGGIRKFKLGERLTKNKGSSWTGRVVGFYSTELTPIGYAIESETEKGSVQIYPEAALRPLPASPGASECPTCNGTGTEGKNSICRDCDETRPTGGSNHGE